VYPVSGCKAVLQSTARFLSLCNSRNTWIPYKVMHVYTCT
jgi:hypothetical protein